MAEWTAEENQTRLAVAYASTDLEIEGVWLAYLALGGSAGPYEVEAYLAALMPMSTHEHNVLAHAVNERLADLEAPVRAPYRDSG